MITEAVAGLPQPSGRHQEEESRKEATGLLPSTDLNFGATQGRMKTESTLTSTM